MKNPKVGERWKFRNSFISEITELDSPVHALCIILQSNDFYWSVNKKTGDSFESFNDPLNWQYLEGQDKP